MKISRIIIFCCLSYVALLILGSIAVFSPTQIYPDFFFLLGVGFLFQGGRRDKKYNENLDKALLFREIFICGLFLGYMQDLLTGSPKGLHIFSYLIVLIILYLIQLRMLTQSWRFILVICFISHFFYQYLVVLLAVTLMTNYLWDSLELFIGKSFITALFAPFFVWMISKVPYIWNMKNKTLSWKSNKLFI